MRSLPAPRLFALLLGLWWLSADAAGAQPCGGDCDGDQKVAISELITCVNIALGAPPTCEACDADGNGAVAINDLINAVDHALEGCPEPTATTTPSPTAVPSPTASRGPTDTPLPTPTATMSVPPTSTATATATLTPTSVPSPRGAFRDVAVSAQGATRLALASLDWFALLDTAQAAALAAAACPGHVTVSCTAAGATAVRALAYAGCQTTTPNGHQVTRDGQISQTVSNPAFCTSGAIGDSDTVTLRLDGYEQTERLNAAMLAHIVANLTVTSVGLGVQGCAGRNADETSDGSVRITCSAAADSVSCPARGADVTLGPDHLARRLQSGSVPCSRLATANGALEINNALTGEQFTQRFDDFQVARTAAGAQPDQVTVNGTMSADCLGAVTVRTQPETALRLAAGTACPVSGTLDVGRPETLSSASGSAASAPVAGQAAATLAGGPRGIGELGVQHRLYRSATGQVYQILQNPGAAQSLGAEAVQITTLVGSFASVAECANAADALSQPQAVAAATGGQAVALDTVVKSERIASASTPCFNRNAEGGRGRLCFGPGCTADCTCPVNGDCTPFTLADGQLLQQPGADVPAAALVPDLQPLANPCSGFEGRSTYRFGGSGPTTQTQVCGAAPTDGFRLPTGSSVVFAYDAAPLALFNAGFGGFPIDVDGQNTIGCVGPVGAGRVLNAGAADQLTAAAARIAFDSNGAVTFDYDGDQNPDKVLADCAGGAVIACAAEPSPTPTPDLQQPCGPVVLESSPEVSVQGSTAGRLDQAGEASCGWGGGAGAPDQTFQFTAPAAGLYDVHVTGAAHFDPYLYVRADNCLSGQAELGCDDDGGGHGDDARTTLTLAAQQQVAIVVDGADAAGGAFTLEVHQRRPDLTVSALTVPAAANAGEQVVVSAQVANVGDGDAGPFRVELVYARDAALTQVVGSGVAACTVDGLGASQSVSCMPPTSLAVPLVGPGSYFIGARVDTLNAVTERNEANNLMSQPTTINVIGAVLEQQLFRANDGTAYQLVRVVPSGSDTPAERYRLTSLAASVGAVQANASGASAAVSAQTLYPFARTVRTAVLQPSDLSATALHFDKVGGGRLSMGAGSGAIEVCRRSEGCGGASTSTPLVPLSQASDGVPAGCLNFNGTRVAFGRPASGDPPACSDGTVSTQICALEPADGFGLAPGQAIVFVYDSDLDPFEVGVAGFGIDSDGSNQTNCGVGQVVLAQARHDTSDSAPLLTFVETVKKDSLVITHEVQSHDGRNRYATARSAGALLVYQFDAAGAPTLVQTIREGVGGVTGLDGAEGLVVSPDDRHVYVASSADDAVVVFTRDAAGLLSELEVNQAGDALFGAHALTISPDGRYVYAVAGGQKFPFVIVLGSVVVFARDTATGRLNIKQILENGDQGVDLLHYSGIAMSADGTQVLLNGRDPTVVFQRDADTGRLQFVGTLPLPAALVQTAAEDLQGGVGVTSPTSVAVSPDGAHVYVGSGTGEGVAVFRRGPSDGRLSFVDVENAGFGGPGGLGEATSMVVSPDGANVYVASATVDAVGMYARIAGTGSLRLLGSLRDGQNGVDGLGGVRSLAVASNGAAVYAASPGDNKLAVLRRDAAGLLSVAQMWSGPPGLAMAVAVGSGGHVYTVWSTLSSPASGLQVFQADAVTGLLGPVLDPGGHPYGVFTDFNFAILGANAIAANPLSNTAYVAITGSFPNIGKVAALNLGSDSVSLGPTVDEEQDQLDALRGARAAAVSPDGAYVYIGASLLEANANPGSLVAFRSQGLVLQEAQRDGVGQVDGLGGASAVAVSPDGAHLYVTGAAENAVAVFAVSRFTPPAP